MPIVSVPGVDSQAIEPDDILTKAFGGRYKSAETRSAALVQYMDVTNKSLADTDSGNISFFKSNDDLGQNTIRRGIRANPKATLARLDAMEKALGGDASHSAVAADIARFKADYVASIDKDWTPTNPVGGTGLTAYDLSEQAKLLVPLTTPIVNSTPRTHGQGNAFKFKRIDSVSNAGVPGGAGVQRIGFNSLSQTSTWGPTGNVTLARPAKIGYTGSDWSVGYVEMGISDSVDFISQFQGLGFDDVRGLSHTASLYAHKMGEERNALYGRGATGNGYQGTVAAPSNITTATATTGGLIPANTYYTYVLANTGYGASVPSTVVSQVTTGATSTIVFTVGTEPVGAITYDVYVGTTTGIANAHYQGTFAGTPFTLSTYNAAGAITTGADNSFGASDYDGYLSIQSNPALTGYLRRVNGALSATDPGTEFDQALAAMYVANGADPDEIWMDGVQRAKLQRLMRIGGSSGASSGYRTNINLGDGHVTMGSSVTGVMNANTGKVLSVNTHRFMPVGAALIRSTSLPLENSRVAAPVMFRNVQDYMLIDWPVIQLTYDLSTYQIGTMVHMAPAWSGLILGLQ